MNEWMFNDTPAKNIKPNMYLSKLKIHKAAVQMYSY